MGIQRQVLVVEDDPFLCGMVGEILEGRGFIVHLAHTAEDALSLLDKHDPEALIVDLDLGHGPSGLDVIGALGDRIAEFGVLVLSNFPSASALSPGTVLPASVGYLMKRKISDPDEVVSALEAVLSDAVPDRPNHSELVPAELSSLTPTQLELLRLIAMGYSNDMIARERNVTLRSVETMVNRLFTALGLSSDPRSNARVKAAMLYARTMGVPKAAST
jgi:DNA-binding NarL/FixJ family response regulator